MFSLVLAIISLLYTTVGQAGGTAFLALMAFAALPSTEIRPTALGLNIVVATYSTWVFNRNKVVDWIMLRPLLLSSMPAAFAGGLMVLGEDIYKTLTGIVLLLAGAVMIVRGGGGADRIHENPLLGTVSIGAAIGLVSGLTGVGGGLFLAPTLIALNWASPKQTAALSPPFVLANSTIGLVGTLLAGQFPSSYFWLYAVAALVGAVAGTMIGLKWMSQTTARFILVAVLFVAGIQLVCT
ncbi:MULTISPECIES: sulfite exporter TauE/SafE family protein [Bradyrhizobium]|uniref:Probable membrane transporter protein n=1 Tax=Bradyrhizobium elkanii TaxID=29448 RepID=A0A4U6RSE4_BRAEL|nr:MULTISPECIES: sulfite exporter TauE/SafE family protein [Bradyrhizobium]MTV11704.1 sulfite exporter TauE/SafE family protein [Bradyrhizobium sp. BR2003]TKV77767.1 sulfite exporter TauE/SafE family protein [Bradyrhizobium elkanii]